MRFLLLIPLLLGSASVQAQSVPASLVLRDPTTPSGATSYSYEGSYFMQGFAGLAVGVAGIFGGGIIGLIIAQQQCKNSDAWFCGFGTVLLSGTGGYTLGVAAGVHGAGRGYPPRGSFGLTLLGSSIGTIAGIGFIAEVTESKYPKFGFAAPIFPIAGAMLAYHTSRNHRSRSALVTCEAGQCGLGLPLVVPTRLPAPGGSEQAYPFVLARIRL